MSDKQQDQVDANYEAFLKELPSIMKEHRDKYALMQNGQIVGFYATIQDAKTTAQKFLTGGPFSIQRVTDVPVDLGFFSHAVDFRSV